MTTTHRDRFLATVLGRPADRVPFYLYWGPWGETWRRWECEGKPAVLRNFNDVRTHFAADTPPQIVPVNCGPCPAIERKVLAEDAESRTHIDSWGIIRRDLKAHESMSEFLRFPVQSRADWHCFRDAHLNPHHPARLAGPWREKCTAWMDAGLPIQLGWFPDVGIFGSYRWLLGDEECLITLHEDPSLAHDIMAHITDLYLAVFEKVVEETRVDVIHFWEDMCSRNGPLMSPAHFEEFISPCYRRIAQFAREHKIPILSVDTDGDPTLLITPMTNAGINFLLPFEVAAGCDINTLRPRFPTLGMMGGVDKRILARDPAAITVEITRVMPAVRAGRYIPDLDHLVPSDVSWPNYSHYATTMRDTLHAAQSPPVVSSSGH